MGLERSLRVRFDRFLKPSSVVRQSVAVSPGRIDPNSGDAPAGTYFFEPIYDPYDRTAIFRQGPGGRWIPSVLHSVIFRAPADANDAAGIRAFDGAPLAKTQELSFRPSDSVSDPAHDVDDGWPAVSWCEEQSGPPKLPAVRQILSKCASSGCHAGTDPAARMNLESSAAVRATALQVLATEVVPTEEVGKTTAAPAVFGQGMPRIDPRNPGNSYLMYKLLINAANYPAPGDPEASDPFWERGLPALQAPSSEEIRRLRDAFVWLDPMPPGGVLSVTEMRTLVVWIASGAEVSDCAF